MAQIKTSKEYDISVKFLSMYRDEEISTVEHEGKPVWIAAEIAKVLELGDEAKLVRRLILDARGCSDVHFHIVRGDERDRLLKSIEAIIGKVPKNLVARARICLITLEGIYALLQAKIGKGISILWNHIRNRCVPEFINQLQEETDSDLQWNQLELEKRQFQSLALEELIKLLEIEGNVDPKVLLAYRVASTEIALGIPLPDLRPRLDGMWVSPTQIAEKHAGISSWRVGRIITKLNLREDPKFSIAVLGKAQGHDGTVVCYLYNREAVTRIEEMLHDSEVTKANFLENKTEDKVRIVYVTKRIVSSFSKAGDGVYHMMSGDKVVGYVERLGNSHSREWRVKVGDDILHSNVKFTKAKSLMRGAEV